MKKLTVICTLLALLTVFSSTTRAVTWTFDLKSTGDPNSWTSLTVVDTGAPQYDYDWQLTEAYLWIEGDSIPIPYWFDLLLLMEEEDKSGSGTELGLPFNVFDPGSPLHIELSALPGITADIYLGVDGLGQGQATVDNITLGSVGPGANATEIWFGMEFTVTPVPEPATVLLLGLGSLVLLRNRRAA